MYGGEGERNEGGREHVFFKHSSWNFTYKQDFNTEIF